tara:strand:+ start:4058 stop:4675 length:618 start_codon:yes stop_codon:yes gene_type:complete
MTGEQVFDALATQELTVASNTSTTSTRKLLEVINEHSSSLNTTPLTIRQDAATRALFIDQNANAGAMIIDTESTGAEAIDIDNPKQTTGNIIDIGNCDALTTGAALNIVSNSSNTSARALIDLKNDNTAAVGAFCLRAVQDALNECISLDMGTLDKGFIDFVATADADATSAISTLNTSGGTTDHIQISLNGTPAWIAVSTTDPS